MLARGGCCTCTESAEGDPGAEEDSLVHFRAWLARVQQLETAWQDAGCPLHTHSPSPLARPGGGGLGRTGVSAGSGGVEDKGKQGRGRSVSFAPGKSSSVLSSAEHSAGLPPGQRRVVASSRNLAGMVLE
jgi:hypothetical protein